MGFSLKCTLGDHHPPHFHAEYAEFSAQISIIDFAVLNGHLPPKALSLVVEWASFHKEELIENWRLLSEEGNGTFRRIEPLR